MSTYGRGQVVGPVSYGYAPAPQAPGMPQAEAPQAEAPQAGALKGSRPYSSGPQVYEFRNWRNWSEEQRVKKIRQIAVEYGSNPQVREVAVRILKQAGVPPRGYRNWKAQKALLKWVQRQIYYVNEPGEILQSPLYTLRVGYADCDDMAILLAALYQAVRLPFRFVLSGVKQGRPVRWVEGTRVPRGVRWSHIYLQVGNQPFSATEWKFAEPTLQGAKLGWDVVQAQGQPLPEMAGPAGYGAAPGPAQMVHGEAPHVMVQRAPTLWEKLTADIDHGVVGKAVLVGLTTGLVGAVVRDVYRKIK